jgi:hypothetical protein
MEKNNLIRPVFIDIMGDVAYAERRWAVCTAEIALRAQGLPERRDPAGRQEVCLFADNSAVVGKARIHDAAAGKNIDGARQDLPGCFINALAQPDPDDLPRAPVEVGDRQIPCFSRAAGQNGFTDCTYRLYVQDENTGLGGYAHIESIPGDVPDEQFFRAGGIKVFDPVQFDSCGKVKPDGILRSYGYGLEWDARREDFNAPYDLIAPFC